VSPEQMEFSRLRAELSKTKMELAIVKKAAAYFARGSPEFDSLRDDFFL
jgi:transposase